MTSDLTEKVKTWLESTGAAFEMAVARTLLDHDLGIQQSPNYVDPDDPTTSREIDVIASASLGFDDNATLDLFAVFECKYAPTPWVVYRSPPHHSGSTPHFDRIATAAGEKWLDRARAMNSISEGPLWQREPRPGYALGTSHPGGQGKKAGAVDQAYKALFGVTKASIALARSLQGDIIRIATIFPVIALRGQLVETWLADGDIVVREISRAQVHWSYPPSKLGRILIDVVTEPELDRLATHIRDAADGMSTEGVDAAREVVRSERDPNVY